MNRADKIGIAIFVGFIIMFAGVTVYAVSVGFDIDNGGKFDHYRTDVEIVVHNNGKITQTETYWFDWKNVSSGEMYLSKPRSMKDAISNVSVYIDGNPMTPASSYSLGRSLTDNNPGTIGWWCYSGINPQTGDYEINAFYPRA
ncbi:MAG: hypothetical protein FWG19_01735, partial [Methanomassiliicoccaceae archaeon]|nr:hypothetical protein [Methanomassiliicoccaceae archaeon]